MKAVLILSTQQMCPLQYSGAANAGNVEKQCKYPGRLEHQDVSDIIKIMLVCNVISKASTDSLTIT
jgi:hypothetical protein